MEIILKHLAGDEQFRFLQDLLENAIPDPSKRPLLIQGIMDDINHKERWLIWSNEHRGWWRPGAQGYTELRSEAGRYHYADALDIVRKADYAPEAKNIPNETMMLDLPRR